MNRSSYVLFLASVLALTGCAAADDETPSADSNDALTGRTEIASSLGTSVVRVFSRLSMGGGAFEDRDCTGALVTSRRVVTSAWCVGAEHLDTLWPRAEHRVATSDRDPAIGNGTSYVDVRLVIGPKRTEEDAFAVLLLDADLPGGVPLALGDLPTNGAPVTAVSYGCVEHGTRTSGLLLKRRLSWNEWSGFFGTDFLCRGGDDGAVILDGAGRLVASVSSSDARAVLPISTALRDAIAKP